MSIPFATARRDLIWRPRSVSASAHGTMGFMEDAAAQIQVAAKKRTRAKEAFDRADAELRDLLIAARAGGMGPSEMARLTGFTREWVARIAPEPKKTP